MVKEKNISPKAEDVSSLELENLGKVSKEDEAKQKSYDKRFKKFFAEFEAIQKKYKIKLIQTPARIVYYDEQTYK